MESAGTLSLRKRVDSCPRLTLEPFDSSSECVEEWSDILDSADAIVMASAEAGQSTESTRAMVRAAKGCQVRDVVLISSMASVSEGVRPTNGEQWRHDDWSSGETLSEYGARCVEREQAAINAWTEDAASAQQLTILCPGKVLGGRFDTDSVGASPGPDYVRRLLGNAGAPKIPKPNVDVCTVAQSVAAVVGAGRQVNTTYERYLLTSETIEHEANHQATVRAAAGRVPLLAREPALPEAQAQSGDAFSFDWMRSHAQFGTVATKSAESLRSALRQVLPFRNLPDTPEAVLNYPWEVVLSHRREETTELAAKIFEFLTIRGVRCFWDTHRSPKQERSMTQAR